MVNILFISNDRRVNGIISYLQPLLKGTLNCTSDFDHGLKDVFDKRPAIVFIQRTIAGVSGDAVAQHIKGLLRDSRPKIVLLQDDVENMPLHPCYDDSIGFVLPEPEIYRLFCNYLRKFPEMHWKDTPSSDGAESGSVPKEADARAAQPEGKKVRVNVPAATGKEPSLKKEAVSDRPSVRAGKNKPADTISEGAASFAGEEMAYGGGDQAMPVTERTFRPRSRVAALASVGLALVLVTCVIAFSLPGGIRGWMPIGNPAKAKPPAAESKRSLHLPAVIVANPVDAAFAAANPGWQRYQGERIDFRVFSPKGEIKVIQVVGQGDASLENAFLNAFLLDLLRSSDRQITSRARNDGYVVEKGTASDNAEIIVYRQEKTDRIKGFVISFS